MRTILLTFGLFIVSTFVVFGQINDAPFETFKSQKQSE